MKKTCFQYTEYRCWKGLKECENCWYEQVVLKQPTPTVEDIREYRQKAEDKE